MKTPIGSACWRALDCPEALASLRASTSGPLYLLAENIGFAMKDARTSAIRQVVDSDDFFAVAGVAVLGYAGLRGSLAARGGECETGHFIKH
jgi:hypothetical protein